MNRHRKVQGVVLPITLVILLLLNMIIVSSMQSGALREKVVGNRKAGIEALLAAEAGLQVAINHLLDQVVSNSGVEDDIDWSVSKELNDLIDGLETSYEISHYVVKNAVAKTADGAQLIKIKATGTAGHYYKQIEQVIAMVMARNGFDFSMTSCESATFDSDVSTHSYSSSGQSSLGDRGDVKTLLNTGHISLFSNAQINGHAESAGNIWLDSESAIYGDATAVARVVQLGDSIITGDINEFSTPPSSPACDPLDVSSLTQAASQLPFTEHPDYGGLSYEIAGNDTDVFQTGNYQFDQFKMDSNAEVLIDGEVVFYIDGDISVLSKAGLKIAPGASLKIYTTGKTRFDSNACLNYQSGRCADETNSAGIPVNMQLYSMASIDDAVILNSDSDYYGVVYAPYTTVRLDSNSKTYGAIQGKQIMMNSNARFIYDEDLGQDGGSQRPVGYELLYWQE